ncbi:hypothetical protein KUV47_06355 [Vannielia litorea]|uniref:hypothetical protein n=1 Tax=Vannielia litorea TaxID=1217970 RepID=UPI001C985C65|nr:hypothetical protein [Vannielia litorea]MBY6047241.1 hypothetical protein [Vannielia litorea]MBY6074655.1 hypothetical protein [Vannielia litorea]MBY6152826.1 hypothetical protein [Vannielia litorea]
MKLFYAGLLSAALAAPAFAGGMNEPVMEPTVTTDEPQMSRDTIAEDTASSGSHDIIVPITALILFGVAVAN